MLAVSMRKAAPLLAVALMVLLTQAVGGLLTVCHARDGQLRLELVHGDCCEGRAVERADGCCDASNGGCSAVAAPDRADGLGPSTESLDVGLADCCESLELLFHFVTERQQEGADGGDFAAHSPALVDELCWAPAGWREGLRRTGPVPRPPPLLASLRTVVFLC